MRKNMMPALAAAFLFALPALTVPARAHTLGRENFTCPICGTEFTDIVSYSGTSFGMRLDFKKTGPVYQPWPVPQCPNCRFVILEETEEEGGLDDDAKAVIKEYLASDEFKAIPKEAPAYYCLAKIKEFLGSPPSDLAHIYMSASWQAEGAIESDTPGLALDWKRNPEFIEKSLRECLRCLDAGVAADAADTIDTLVLEYLRVEINRRLGDFPVAEERLKQTRMGLDALLAADAKEADGGGSDGEGAKEEDKYAYFKMMLNQQEKLIGAKNGEPQMFTPE